MAGRGKKQHVSYTKPEEPPFLRKIKEKIGYKEPDTVETKLEKLPEADDPNEDEEKKLLDEECGPQIVVLKPGKDLDESEVAKVIQEKQEEEDKKKIDEGKIVFRKPAPKRPAEDETKASDEKSKKSREDKRKAISDNRLLSFEEDEED